MELLAFQERSGCWPGLLDSPSSCSNIFQGSSPGMLLPRQLLFGDGIGRKSSPSRQANCRQAMSWWNRSSPAVWGFNLQCLCRPCNKKKAALLLCPQWGTCVRANIAVFHWSLWGRLPVKERYLKPTSRECSYRFCFVLFCFLLFCLSIVTCFPWQ